MNAAGGHRVEQAFMPAASQTQHPALAAEVIWYRSLLPSLLENSSTPSTASTPFQGRRPGITVAQAVRPGKRFI